MKKQVVIIGAGAAGLFAAIAAAREGATVTILEHTDKIGKKLLATGNGKCNLTNESIKSQSVIQKVFRSEHLPFVETALQEFGYEQTISFWENLGILTKSVHGYIYPQSEQAVSVLEILKYQLERYHIIVQTDCEISDILKREHRFWINTSKGNYVADSCILACGGMAAPKTGSDGSGYEFAKACGHTLILPVPALTALLAKDKCTKLWAGVRVDGEVGIWIDGKLCIRQKGQLQLTDYGISGIPVFEVSRFCTKAWQEKKTVQAVLDFMPDYTKTDLLEILKRKSKNNPGTTIQLLTGILNVKLAKTILQKSNLPSLQKDSDFDTIVHIMKNFTLPLTGARSFEQAQVTAGGIDVAEIHAKTMESKKLSGLYFAGEIMDVDGTCGGYNLQWAWTSGYLSGTHAAKGNNYDTDKSD